MYLILSVSILLLSLSHITKFLQCFPVVSFYINFVWEHGKTKRWFLFISLFSMGLEIEVYVRMKHNKVICLSYFKMKIILKIMYETGLY